MMLRCGGLWVRRGVRSIRVTSQKPTGEPDAVIHLIPRGGVLPDGCPSNSAFTGQHSQILTQHHPNDKKTVCVGLGDEDKCHIPQLRRAVHAGLGHVTGTTSVVLPNELPHWTKEDMARHVATTAVLSTYRFDRFRTKQSDDPIDGPARKVEEVHVCGAEGDNLTTAVERGSAVGRAITYSRDLANTPGSDGTPSYYEQEAVRLAASHPDKVRIHVLHDSEMREMGMGLITAVGRAAVDKPRIVVLDYLGTGDPSATPIVVVGKGVTYDTGGLHIKLGVNMLGMHLDMHGAATVLGLIKALAESDSPVRVVGALGLAENAVGPLSYKPGDVLKSFKGLTVEVGNTDAEGRLVLGDTMTYLQRTYNPDIMVDLATLTGAAVAALGEERGAVLSPCDTLAEELLTAARLSDEGLWRLPLGEDYTTMVKGTVGDITNYGSTRDAGCCQAGAFLQHFVEDGVQWAHLDIAGPAMYSENRPYRTKGATGYGVETLLTWLAGKKVTD